MEEPSHHTAVIILAAGKGTRMSGGVPKVLTPLGGRPMMSFLLDAVEKAGICQKPVAVVGFGAAQVQQAFGDRCDYVLQESQKGTGHAVACAQEALEGKADTVMVLYGDHPLIHPSTIQRLQDFHHKEGCVLTLLTAILEDFEDWRKPWDDFGRVIRNAQGAIERVVEVKDATPEQRQCREVNLGLYCFNARWLWSHIHSLSNQNVQQEYHLVGLIESAMHEGEAVATMAIDPKESLGVNTPEHLQIAEKFLKERV